MRLLLTVHCPLSPGMSSGPWELEKTWHAGSWPAKNLPVWRVLFHNSYLLYQSQCWSPHHLAPVTHVKHAHDLLGCWHCPPLWEPSLWSPLAGSRGRPRYTLFLFGPSTLSRLEEVQTPQLPIPMSYQPQPSSIWFACIQDVCEDKDAFQISLIKGN